MKNKLFILLFVISAFFAGCAKDDFRTVINLGDGSQDSDSEQVALSGEVKDEQGNPIAGVLVSDGYQTTTTNEVGYYEIYSDLTRSRFVYITTPKDFEIQYENGIPKFWKNIPKGVQTFKGDFVLTRRTASADRYTILMTADPQIRGKHMNSDNLMFHSVDIYQDMCQDLMDAAAKVTDRPVYSICLGDMVHNDMSMWNDYCAGIKNFNFPVFHVIGNHDHIQNVETDEESLAEYERYLGPTNYGVELGDLHYIFIDNIVMKDNRNCPKTTGEYTHGLSDQVVEWLRGYLAHVDKNKTLMLITHSPFYKKVASDPAQSDMNASVYTNLLQPYKYIHS